MSNPDPTTYLREAIDLAVDNVRTGRGGPFAALVVRNGEVLGQGTNVVTTTNDPTAHAEVVAIRRACDAQGEFQLDGCVLYSTCEPCPMCLSAIYWARIDRVYYAATQDEAAAAGFDDEHIYEELCMPPPDRTVPMKQCLHDASQRPFEAWLDYDERVEY